jgi:hypothetical protein
METQQFVIACVKRPASLGVEGADAAGSGRWDGSTG